MSKRAYDTEIVDRSKQNQGSRAMRVSKGADQTSTTTLQISRRSLMIGATGVILATTGLASQVKPAGAAILDNKTRLTRARLDELAARSYGIFNENKVLPEFDNNKYQAAIDVELHRITTFTQVPETGETVKISGLLALPAGAKGPLPVLSWQHGTTFSFMQAPSNLYLAAEPDYVMKENVDSQETLFNIHRFAANGYAVIAADYIGKGPYHGSQSETYAVKNASTRTSIDILNAGLEGMRQLGVEPAELFLNGWSQGGLNTQWLHQALQTSGIPVRAAGASSPFNDVVESFDFWTGSVTFPDRPGVSYPPRPKWLTLSVILVLGSYQSYYRLDDLIDTVARPEYVPMVRKFLADYDMNLDFSKIPMPEDLLIESASSQFVNETYSRFRRQLAANTASYFEYSNPIRLFYGLADEPLHPTMCRRAVNAGGPMMDGVAISGASHRVTFLASLYGEPDQLQGRPNLVNWFNSLRAD